MSRIIIVALMMFFITKPAFAQQPANAELRIAFGSCFDLRYPPAIWDTIAKSKPDVFIHLGDNIYADTDNAAIMESLYDQLKALEGYKQLKSSSLVTGTWDDHDYGKNDAGAEFEFKPTAQKLFLNFLDVPQDDPRRQREGVYHSDLFEFEGQVIQFIHLDTRSFRSPLKAIKRTNNPPAGVNGNYTEDVDPNATVLGEAQWAWLADELRRDANLRIISSSIQVIPAEHGFEKWSNFPRERARLFDMLGATKSPTIMISGDRHHAEMSRLAFVDEQGQDKSYLYDITSSSLNKPSKFVNEMNRYRHGAIYRPENWGMITLTTTAQGTRVTIQILSQDGVPVLEQTHTLAELVPHGKVANTFERGLLNAVPARE